MENPQSVGPANIFEAANENLKEIYVGCAALDEDEGRIKARALHRNPSWRPEHKIACRIVEASLTEPGVDAFISNYVRAIARLGWAVITD